MYKYEKILQKNVQDKKAVKNETYRILDMIEKLKYYKLIPSFHVLCFIRKFKYTNNNIEFGKHRKFSNIRGN